MSEHLTRQMDLIPMEKLNQPIVVIGCGAIGSFTVLALTKMGFENITVYDFDEVSVENMNCQWYRFGDIGQPKALALQSLVEDFTKIRIKAHNEAFEDQALRGIVISAVDSMKVRKVIWDASKDNHFVRWFIDPRMAAEYAVTTVMDPNDSADQASYEKTLFSDEKGVHEPCTAKSTIYTATMIAGYVAKHVKDLVTGKQYARVTHWDIAKNQLLNWPKKDSRP